MTARDLAMERSMERTALLQEQGLRSGRDGCTSGQRGGRQCEAKNTKRGVDLRFMRYLWKILRLMFPTWKSTTLLFYSFLLVVRAVEEFTVYNAGLVPSMFYAAIDSRDVNGFKRVLWQGALAVASAAVSKTACQWVSGLLYVRWRALITQGLQRLYFKDILYYQLQLEKQGIDNPDQRLTQDVDKFCQELKKVVPQVVIAPFVIVYYTYKTYASMGFYGPLSIFAFALLAAFLNRFLMGPVVRSVCKQEAREGDFRFHHVQFRMYSDSVAFYRGGSAEGRNAARNLSALTAAQSSVINWGLPLNLSVNMFDYSGAILSYCLIGIPVFAGMYDHLNAAALSSLISKNAFVSMYLINNCTSLLDLSSNFSDLTGYTHRIGELLFALKQLDAQVIRDRLTPESNDEKECSVDSQESDGSDGVGDVGVDVKHLSVTPPGWDAPLLKDVSFKLRAGQNILIVGENGSGKSSLLRVISGLWEAQEGSINLGVCYGPNGLFVLPQTTYLTTGSLADQVAFPELAKDTEVTYQPSYGCRHGVDRTTEALQMTGVLYLRDRLGGLSVPLKSDQNWYDYVSPGEAQCISFARLFFHRPQFAILDEATSALSETNEEQMYSMLKMLGITYMSIGHRSSLKQYHDVVLHLTEDTCLLEAVGQEAEETVVSVTHPAIGRSHGIQRTCI